MLFPPIQSTLIGGRFLPEVVAGAGGMGTVYRARDVLELRIAVRMVGSLVRLLDGLETEVELVQESADGLVADRMAPCPQLLRELVGALAGPSQRRPGVAARHGIHQRIQVA
jgi:hypothetical protein